MNFSLTRPLTAAVLAGALAALVGQQAVAGDWRYRDQVYADSFGNLVINSAAGYKRIVVGQGHLAKEVAAYTGAGEPDVVMIDEYDGSSYARNCKPVLLKGRSYMYGLPDGVVPTLGCRR